ncbi:MAG: bifunctional phosphoribosylaminoimidazolecarboxamide formyltransferase/IMP cyclohydrolase [Vicingaceae bacterium]|tara:strand:- start:2603 stop:4135 length:1533 start_codon:yes stop_codon:yes gene_type:complete
MSDNRIIKNALISVFYKDGLDAIGLQLQKQGVNIYSTGGTQKHLENLGINIQRVEDLTSYPSILGGRVKTLHPKVFGGILSRRGLKEDEKHLAEYEIPEFDLVIVDLYPFEETLANGGSESEIIEKIDIGGISLIRAAAKNFKDVLTVSSREQYDEVLSLLKEKNGETSKADRKALARKAFDISSHYDSKIFDYFNAEGETESLKVSERSSSMLRYGENPHQKGSFYGDLNAMFEKLHGKELSYNNLLDVDAAVNLIAEFKNDDPTFAILKHNNACGIATRKSLSSAYAAALAGDPVSAFGGVLISNETIDIATAEQIHLLFCEVVIAPSYQLEALEILQGKKNRIILRQNEVTLPTKTVRTALNGYLVQDKDLETETKVDFKTVTNLAPTEEEKDDLVFAAKMVKNTKSNAIVFVKHGQLLASGTGQTSRVDALQQAIVKANHFGFDLAGAVMASDAFFPFPDCVEIAKLAGITAVVQPGGSIKDQLSIDYCNNNDLKMVFTGVRHFKH